MSKKVVYGIYDDEEVLLTAVKEIRSKDISIKEVYTPFPVHGLDHALRFRKNKISNYSFHLWGHWTRCCFFNDLLHNDC